MANDVSEQNQNVIVALPVRVMPPKTEEKLFRKKSKPVDKKRTGRSFEEPKNQASQKVESDNCKTRKPNNSLKRKRVMESDCEYSTAMDRAKAIQASLGPEFPTFVKYMLPSHVTGGFWLGLPATFCQSHLPKQDTMIVLEDDNGKEYETKYLSGKVGLSAGWRGYSIAHSLVEGDVLVFHMVKRSKFKIYTVRANGSDEVEGALGLLRLEGCGKQMDSKKIVTSHVKVEDKCLDHLLQAITQENVQNESLMVKGSDSKSISDHSENETEDLVCEVLDGIRLAESDIGFQEVNDIDNFNIMVNGLIINSEFPKHIINKYFELCHSQKSYIHEHLLEGLCYKIAVGAITEITNIADAIRASNITTSPNEFSTWDTTLKAFEVLGMNVGFLRARIDQLMRITDKSKRCSEAKRERDQAEEELRNLEGKVLEVKELIGKLDAEIESPDLNPKELEAVFKQANASWG